MPLDACDISLYSSNDSILYSNVQGGIETVHLLDEYAQLSWGPGNIDIDPCFVDPGYWDINDTPNDMNDDIWHMGDYHLKSEGWRWDATRNFWDYDSVASRSIDAGNPGSPLQDEPQTIPDDPNNDWGQNIRINMGAYGGTPHASIPPYDWTLLADITNDGTANFKDFAYTALYWLQQGDQLPSDFNRDDTVDPADLRLLTNDWLTQTAWH